MHAKHHFNARLLSGYSHETLEEIYADSARIESETRINVTNVENIFAVIRHPYDLELSNYVFFRNGRKNVLRGSAFQVPHILDKVELAQGSVREFVERSGYFRGDNSGRGYRTEDYFRIRGEIPDNVTLLRFENLEEEFPLAMAPFLAEKKMEFPHSNKSAPGEGISMDELDGPTKIAIYKKHRWLFDETRFAYRGYQAKESSHDSPW